MGLDAFVNCRCWQDGNVTEPPVPRSLIVDEGEGLDFSGPDDQMYYKFRSWQTDACAHEHMEIASERISNWGGYRLFQDALSTAGWEHFPTLEAQLPEANGGSMPASAAGQALEELRYFSEQAELGTETHLVDVETGAEIQTYIAAYDGVFLLSNPWRIGVDPQGFFVWDVSEDPVSEDSPREVFRAMRCTQQEIGDGDAPDRRRRFGALRLIQDVMGIGPRRRRQLVRITDVDSAAEVTVNTGPVGVDLDDDRRYPRSLEVVTRAVTADDFDYILEPLATVCRAAAETGNPVVWC
jgi:hypothetical protein